MGGRQAQRGGGLKNLGEGGVIRVGTRAPDILGLMMMAARADTQLDDAASGDASLADGVGRGFHYFYFGRAGRGCQV